MTLHHVNGDRLDNRIENLQILCANCHSQTSTFGGRNGRRLIQ
jgi:5-methylcytosine-specific restriction endonuclease McrA